MAFRCDVRGALVRGTLVFTANSYAFLFTQRDRKENSNFKAFATNPSFLVLI